MTQHLEYRQVGDAGAIGQAVTFEIRDVLAPEGLPELVEEPRLAEPRLAHDAHDLAVSGPDRRQAASQQLEFLATAHEGRHAPLGGQPRALPSDQRVHGLRSRSAGAREMKAPLEERSGRAADQSVASRRRRQQGLEHAPLGSLRVGVDLGGRP